MVLEGDAVDPSDAPSLSGFDPGQTHFDVIIVGAGLSGIGAAYHLLRDCPGKSFTLLESREAIGGTWDLFRYPGVRSDSDMHTLGYGFKPWREAKAIADGPSILRYIRETAKEYGIDRKIQFGQRVVKASWSSSDTLWTVKAENSDGTPVILTCNFLQICSGYYDYDEGYMPGWPGMDSFRGKILHPQRWPDDVCYDGARVVVIGSGATAVTLVPAMAERAAHVTMLQRSPTYIVARPSTDVIANWMHRRLPAPLAHWLARWKNILLQMYFYDVARRKPETARRTIMKLAQEALGPDIDVGKHFNPRYNPWDERLCLVPDGDLFSAVRSGKASVATDDIETFVENGLRLKSGECLEADIIITATGLKMKLMGGMDIVVDGASVDLARTMSYKGMMFSDIPNLATSFGYTNASWTLKCDLTSEYLCRLLNYMERHGYAYCTPRRRDPNVVEESPLPLNSGYVQRAKDELPRQGSKTPWKLHQNYVRDLLMLRFGAIDDSIEFTSHRPSPMIEQAAAHA